MTFVSTPDGAVNMENKGFRVTQEPTTKVPKREIKIFYKTEDMLTPCLRYASRDNEVACMFSVVPTFEQQSNPQEEISSDTPMSQELSQGKDFLFVFLVDCSGSMSGSRIDTAKRALSLFIQSLPQGSEFSILLFGTTSQYFEGKDIYSFDKDKGRIVSEIETIRANLGGTNIISPL